MTIPAWTTSIPQKFLLEGYAEKARDTMLRTEMELGPAKVRRRTTAGVREINGSMIMTPTELASFITFYQTTLKDGSLRFSMNEPVSGASCEMRFTASPAWDRRGLNYYVQMQLEILP